jgi:hypothetical protein
MIKLTNILTEAGLTIYKIEVLIKTSKDQNKVHIYNQIRGLENVVVVTIEQSEFLQSKSTDTFEYALLHMKYLVTDTPQNDINLIKKDAMVTTNIPGILQFIPRLNTIEKVGEY